MELDPTTNEHNPAEHQKNPGLKAECVYFYYLTPGEDDQHGHNHPKVEAFFIDQKDDIKRSEIEGVIRDFVPRILNGYSRPCGWAFGDLRWHRRSYICIIVNDPKFVLSGTKPLYGGGHTFFDGKYLDLSDFSEHMTGMYFLNHMVKRAGSWVGHLDPDSFDVGINLDPRSGVPLDRRSHYDTGTNMGPPVPPP